MFFHPKPRKCRPRRKGDEFSYFHMKNEKITRNEGMKKEKMYFLGVVRLSSLGVTQSDLFFSPSNASRSLMDGKGEWESIFVGLVQKKRPVKFYGRNFTCFLGAAVEIYLWQKGTWVVSREALILNLFSDANRPGKIENRVTYEYTDRRLLN